MIWVLLVYLLMSFIFMGIAKLWREEYPFTETVICFIIGGAIFIAAILTGFIKFINNEEK